MDGMHAAHDATKAFRQRVATQASMMLAHANAIIAGHGAKGEHAFRKVTDHKGREIELLVPGFWSDNAAKILATKYFRRAGVPDRTTRIPEDGVPAFLYASTAAADATFGAETEARQAFHRLAGCWTYWLCRRTVKDRDALLDEEDGQDRL